MQYNNKEYNPELHDRWEALTVKQPYANDLVTYDYSTEDATFAIKSIEVRSRPIKYRGDLLICSSAKPIIAGLESGVTLGIVELYDIKPISEFTADDWEKTRIPIEKRAEIKGGYGWLMRNPLRVIEFPIKGQLGIYKLVYTKDIILPYPTAMVMDKKGYESLKNK